MMVKLTAFLLTPVGKIICFLILGLYYRAFLNECCKFYSANKEKSFLKRIFFAAVMAFAKLLLPSVLTLPILAGVIFSLFMSPVETEYKTVTREVTYSNHEDAYDAGYDAGYNDAYEEMEREEEEARDRVLDNVRGY